MHKSEENRLRRELRRYVLAAADMRQVVAAAEHLAGEHLDGELCRALETAIVVCYARPFAGGNKTGSLGEEWDPPLDELVEVHHALLAARDQVYAHTDKTDARAIIHFAEWKGVELDLYVEQWMPIDRAQLPTIIKLAMIQGSRLNTAAEDCRRALSGET